jgi:transposase
MFQMVESRTGKQFAGLGMCRSPTPSRRASRRSRSHQQNIFADNKRTGAVTGLLAQPQPGPSTVTTLRSRLSWVERASLARLWQARSVRVRRVQVGRARVPARREDVATTHKCMFVPDHNTSPPSVTTDREDAIPPGRWVSPHLVS